MDSTNDVEMQWEQRRAGEGERGLLREGRSRAAEQSSGAESHCNAWSENSLYAIDKNNNL